MHIARLKSDRICSARDQHQTDYSLQGPSIKHMDNFFGHCDPHPSLGTILLIQGLCIITGI